MAKDCQGLTVHAVSFVHGRGPVFYTSMPCANEALKGYGTDGAGEKHRLVSFLWDQLRKASACEALRGEAGRRQAVAALPAEGALSPNLAATESPLWKRCQSSNRAAFPIQAARGLLGRPHLLLGEYRGPAISFSAGGGKVWAALCGDESDVGIDVAGADEFQRAYPFHRVFHPQELEHAVRTTGGDVAQAAALLWSIKEAAVKALGCAFHLVDPRQIIVYPSAAAGGEHTFPVGLSGKALVRFPFIAGRSLWVRSLPQRKMWLSIALLNRRPTGLE